MRYLFQLLTFFCLLFCSSCQRDFDIPPEPTATGNVTFWAEKSCAPGSLIIFSINNTTDTIDNFSANSPACGAAGTNTFELPVGTYNWKAYCATDSLSGVVEILQGDCKSVDLTFPDPPATGKVSFWAKKGCSPGGIVFSIDDIEDSVTVYSAAEPGCGATGTKTFSLPVGTYTWSAYCASDTISGTIDIVKDQCALIDVTFPEQPLTDTEYIKFKSRCDSLAINGNTGEVININESGTFEIPPFTVTEAVFQRNTTSIQVSGSYDGEPENWYGVLFTGPASADGEHIVAQMKLPGMVVGMSDTLKVNIKKYGDVGDFIEGDLKGRIRDDLYNKVFDVEMEFRVRRRQ